MCSVQAVRKGLRDITANKKAILLLWLTNLILALAVAFPFFGWLGRMNRTVAAEAMLKGFSLPLLFDLAEYEFAGIFSVLGTLVFWMVLCGSLISTLTTGGVLTVLTTPGDHSFLEHFFAGAGRYFSRFLRLLLVGGLFAAAVLVGFNALAGMLVAKMSDGGSETTLLLLGLGQGLLTVLLGTPFLLALHYARIQTVVEGRTAMIRVYLHSLVFVLRNILGVFAVLIFFAALAGIVHLMYIAVRTALPATTWPLILVLIAIQQIVVLTRSAFQVGLYGGELQLFLLRRPKLPEPATLIVAQEAPKEPEDTVSASEAESNGLTHGPARTNTD